MFNKKQKRSLKTVDQLPIETVISVDTELKGDVSGKAAIRVDGKIDGNIEVISGVVLGEKSVVNGNINSNSVVVYGQLNGNLNAKELVIKNTAQINGDIFVETLEIEQGGKYNGTLKMDKVSTEGVKENVSKKK